MTEFRFAEPLFLGLIGTLVIVSVANRRYRLLPTPTSFRYSDIRLIGKLPRSWRIKLRFIPSVLTMLGVVLLIIGLARPQVGGRRDIIRGQGVAIVLAADISQSMSAKDFAPENRLEAAKRVMQQFISQRQFDTIGLVVFARNAFHQAPLTLDYTILLRLLEGIRLASELQGQQDGTAIGLGLASAVNMLRASTSPSRVVILLTDGANNAGIDPIQIAHAARALEIRVYPIGMGRAGFSTIEIDGALQTVPTDLDEETLQQIATITNGLYYRAEDSEGLQHIYDRINRLEKSDAEREVYVQWRDIPEWAILPALLCLVCAYIVRYRFFDPIP